MEEKKLSDQELQEVTGGVGTGGEHTGSHPSSVRDPKFKITTPAHVHSILEMIFKIKREKP